MTKKLHFLLMGLAVVSFLLVGCKKELPTSGMAQADDPLRRIGDTAPGRMKHVQPPPTTLGDPIELVDPSTLTCDGLVTFDDVPGGADPGTNFDGIFESGFAYLAERFVGQILSASGDFDVLSGTPTGPLALQVGATKQNLNVFTYAGTGSHVLTGLGPTGYPSHNAIGEGSFAVLFDFDQSEIGLDIVGAEGGSATVNFFKRDGSLLQTIVLAGLMGNQSFGFMRADGTNDIAGFSIHNDDPHGIGYDNLCHDVQGVPGPGVLIDIKPGSEPNSINCNNQKGVIPVAILTTDEFDATTVDHTTVEFEGAKETHVDKKSGEPRRHEEDVDGDGDADLVLHFRLGDTDLTCDSREGTLTGDTFDGQAIEGTDSVNMIGGSRKAPGGVLHH